MAIFCIPRALVQKLKDSAIKGEVDIAKLYELSSKERNEFFAKLTDKDLGKLINTEFEKAMVSKSKTALVDWAESVFDPKEKTKPVYKNVLDKINNLDEMGVLDPKTNEAFLQDLVSDKLGATVTPEEIAVIKEKAIKINEAQEKLGNDLGNPEKPEENLEFFKAKADMDKYLLSVTPASKLKVLTGTIGRGMMLASVKSPILNIASNMEVGFTEMMSRRIANGTLKGTDNALAVDYVKMVNKIYKETGYDISRMTSIKDAGESGARVLGDTVHTEGPGAVRKVGKIVEDTVFKQLMGAPDAAFASVHFADSVNLAAMKMAKGDMAKAKKIMEDAMRIEPQTPEGELLRQQGILDAQTATWTNKTWASRVSEGIRKIFNDVSGDLRIGDYLFPFIKTPANVIATSLDYAGLGIPKAMYTLAKGLKDKNLDKNSFKSISRDLTRAGLGLTGAVILTSYLNDDDFVGAYDPARKQIEELRNSTENSIRIGGKWINVAWLGPLATPVMGIMYARKNRGGAGEKAFSYIKGAGATALTIPGVADIYDTVKSQSYSKDKSLNEMLGETFNYASSQAFSRLVPSIVSDTAKMTDEYVREGSKGTEGIKSKVPGLRQTLPVKENIFGEQLKNEPWWSTLLFGARVKTDKETDMIKELSDLQESTGKTISFTDWDKSSSSTLGQFRQKVGQEVYDEAKHKYGAELKKQLDKLLSSSAYKKLSNEDKVTNINSIDSGVQAKILKQYKFKYKSPPKKTLVNNS